jgi:hypothetical protein
MEQVCRMRIETGSTKPSCLLDENFRARYTS